MQAIQTKFIGATNIKPTRIKAWCEAGSITVSYSYEGDIDHDRAVQALCAKLRADCWQGKEFVRGGTPNGFVYVFANDHKIKT